VFGVLLSNRTTVGRTGFALIVGTGLMCLQYVAIASVARGISDILPHGGRNSLVRRKAERIGRGGIHSFWQITRSTLGKGTIIMSKSINCPFCGCDVTQPNYGNPGLKAGDFITDPESAGLYGKYRIAKADGSPTDPGAQYFVLRIDTDQAARMALFTYAAYIEHDQPEFASELRQWLDDTGPGFAEKM